MQTLDRPSSTIDKAPAPLPQVRKCNRLRSVAEFLLFLTVGLLILEPILTLAGVSYDPVKLHAARSQPTTQSHVRRMLGPFHPDHSAALNLLDSNENPDVLILGSSLVLWPALACDGYGVPHTKRFKAKFNWPGHTKCKYLERLLSAKSNRPISLRNVGLRGSTMDDHTLIFTTALSRGKRPKLLVACIHPAQFFSTKSSLPEYRSLNMELRPPKRDWSLDILKDRLFGAIYEVREKRRRDGITAAGGRHVDRYFQSVYSDSSGLNRAYDKLTEMIQAAKSYDVPLLVVDMPTLPEHEKRIDKGLLEQYRQRVTEICRANSTPYYNCNELQTFTARHFQDDTHMNKRGGKKFYALLSEVIANDPNANRQLCAKQSSEPKEAAQSVVF